MVSQDSARTAPVFLKPGVISAYKNGWKQLWPHFLMLFLIGVIYLAISYVGVIPQWIAQFTAGYNLGNEYTSLSAFEIVAITINIIYGLLIGYPLLAGVLFAFLKAARGEKVEIQDMFAGFKNYWNTVLASLMFILMFVVIIGLAMVINAFFIRQDSISSIFFFSLVMVVVMVAMIFFMCKLAFMFFLVVDKRMKAVEAFKASWRMTNGYGWKLFLYGLLGYAIIIAGFICLIIGAIISYMWFFMALASFYHAVDMSEGVAVRPETKPDVIVG